MTKTYLLRHICKDDNGQTINRLINIYNTHQEATQVIEVLRHKNGFCDYSIKCFVIDEYYADITNWWNGFGDTTSLEPVSSTTETAPVHQPAVPTHPTKKVLDPPTEDRMRYASTSRTVATLSNPEEYTINYGHEYSINKYTQSENEAQKPGDYLKFNGYNYEISGAEVGYYLNEKGFIMLCPDISASFANLDDQLDFEICDVRLYHDAGFTTSVAEFFRMNGMKFNWRTEINYRKEEAGFCYVVEHENVTSGCIEILTIAGEQITFNWVGCADVYWDDEFDANVPFDLQVTCKLVNKDEI